MRVTIGGLVFESDPRDVDDAFLLTRLTGWFGAAGVRREETQRPAAHGSFDSPGYRDAKVPFLEGTVTARSPGALAHKCRQLEALLSDGGQERVSVQDERGHVTWQVVRLAQPAVVTDFGDGETADFQVGFWSPLAETYGEARLFTGSSAKVYHRGSLPAPVRVRIPNGPAAYTISSPGGVFQVAGAPSGGEHVVDLRTGRVTRNGVLLSGVVTRAETWDVPAGPGWVHSISAGSPTWETVDTFA